MRCLLAFLCANKLFSFAVTAQPSSKSPLSPIQISPLKETWFRHGLLGETLAQIEAEQVWKMEYHGLNDAHANIWKYLREYNHDWSPRDRETALLMRRVGSGRCTKN
jgi:hypothetical protein